MDKLLRDLCGRRQLNVEKRWFVPRPAIDGIVDKTAISKIAEAMNLPIDEEDRIFANSSREGLVHAIHAKAKIAFVVSCYVKPHCLRHIVRLIHHGDGKGSKIDRRLPLSKSRLLKCGFDDHDASTFFEAQWQFVAPKIQLGTVVPTEFGQDLILPFQAAERDGRSIPDTGAFGKVTKICIAPGHQVEPAYGGPLLRKQFKPEKNGKSSLEKSFLKELRNLAIISSARHENIVQLLSAYVQGDTFNFIFPLASHANLSQLFQGVPPSSWTAVEVVMALCGLASALVTMHQFRTENLHLIGCHRDLKPANILVDEKRLLLADFGLSRFVDSQERSTSTAPDVNDDFIAPEHESKDFSLNKIGRSSDIWAFGCVTLIFLVFSLHGKEGVDQLQSQRRTVPWPRYAHHYFHDYDKPNSGLEKLFKQLASSTSASTRGLLHLIEKMLVLQKDERPKAAAIDGHMRSLVIHLWSTNIEEEFDKAREGEYIHVVYERSRFKGWFSAIIKINEYKFPEFRGNYASPSYSEFKIVIEHLQELQKMLVGFNGGRLDQERGAFLPVGSRIDRLWETLDEEQRNSAIAYTECNIFATNRLGHLDELRKFSEQTWDKRTEGKAIVRCQILQPSNSGNLQVEFSCLEPEPLRGNVVVTRVLKEGGPDSDLVVVEETKSLRCFQSNEVSIDNAERVSLRLQEIANLLTSSADKQLFKVLHCRGFYCYPRERRSGLLYELPCVKNVRLEKMFTLHEILDRRKSGRTAWLLGERFRLAHDLARAVYELHTVSWLHRNISASNIVFFCKKEADVIDPQSFYFIGFAQSRADRDLTYTDGPISDEYYEHPEHLSRRERYQMRHDYYALGMLLLEIGLWKLLPDAIPDWPSILDKKKTVIEEIIPQLGAAMGTSYRDAVLACLDDKPSGAMQRGQKVPMVFRSEVVERLGPAHCRA